MKRHTQKHTQPVQQVVSRQHCSSATSRLQSIGIRMLEGTAVEEASGWSPCFSGLLQSRYWLTNSNCHISLAPCKNSHHAGALWFLTSWSWDSFFLEDKFKCFSKMPQYFSVSLSYFFLASWRQGWGWGESKRLQGYRSEVAGSLLTFVCSQFTIPSPQNDDAPAL